MATSTRASKNDQRTTLLFVLSLTVEEEKKRNKEFKTNLYFHHEIFCHRIQRTAYKPYSDITGICITAVQGFQALNWEPVQPEASCANRCSSHLCTHTATSCCAFSVFCITIFITWETRKCRDCKCWSYWVWMGQDLFWILFSNWNSSIDLEINLKIKKEKAFKSKDTYLLYVFSHELPCTPVHALQLSWPLLTR